jgi:hypothetical protein
MFGNNKTRTAYWNDTLSNWFTKFDTLFRLQRNLNGLLFAPGADISIAVCRFALFYATLQSLLYLDGAFVMLLSRTTFNSPFIWTADLTGPGYYELWLTRITGTPWVPKGLVKLFFASAPPAPDVMYTLVGIAYASTIAAMFGFLTRLSAPISVLSVLLVSSIFTSWGAYWSHGFNVVHLAGLAFMFARSGDRLSIDAAIRRIWSRSAKVSVRQPNHYRWPVLIGELSIHLFLFAAFWSKFTNGGGIDWALSDNLRNSLAVTWGTYRSSPPLVIDFVIAHLWVFRFVGLAQLFMQGVTIFSCLLIHRPIWRAIVGGLFMSLEILGLGVLFEFWHWNWMPLVAFSIDWDRLVQWIALRLGYKRKLVAAYSSIVLQENLERQLLKRSFAAKLLAGYLAVFLAYYVANFVFQLGEKHLNYPFSSMAFFSENRALRPYKQAADWSEFRGRISLFEHDKVNALQLAHVPSGLGELSRAQSTVDRLSAMQSIVNTSNTGYGWCLAKAELDNRQRWKPEYSSLRSVDYERICSHSIAPSDLRRVELFRSVSVVPARPESPLPMIDVHKALVGVYNEGQVATIGVSDYLDPATDRWYIRVEPRGLDIQSMTVLFRNNVNFSRHYRELPNPLELKGSWIGQDYLLDESEHRAAALWTFIRVTDRKLGELTFWGPILYPYARGKNAVKVHGKPIGH